MCYHFFSIHSFISYSLMWTLPTCVIWVKIYSQSNVIAVHNSKQRSTLNRQKRFIYDNSLSPTVTAWTTWQKFLRISLYKLDSDDRATKKNVSRASQKDRYANHSHIQCSMHASLTHIHFFFGKHKRKLCYRGVIFSLIWQMVWSFCIIEKIWKCK